ncbi:MAG: hypothetical protein AAF517_09500 [Planctomycetota bacterium]
METSNPRAYILHLAPSWVTKKGLAGGRDLEVDVPFRTEFA